jgi:hypothetical protein
LNDVLENAKAAGLTVHMPLTFETPKERKISNVVKATLSKLNPIDHAEAISKISQAAATG